MGRISKIKQLDLERETIQLSSEGYGPVTIAKKLNEKYDLGGSEALVFNNVINFLNSVPKITKDYLKEEHIEEVYIAPLRQLKSDLSELRGPLLERAKEIFTRKNAIMTKDEMLSLTTYLKHFEQIWDRIAKIEHVLKPEETFKAKNVLIIQQYNTIKDIASEVISQCPNCKEKFMNKLEKAITVDAKYEEQSEMQ